MTEHTVKGFPKELLAQSVEERVTYFEKYTVAHPKLIETFETLLDTIYNPGNRSIILLYGPSGVGKTTLYQRIVQKVWENAMPILKKDQGRIPIVGVEALSPDNGSFSWKDFYIRSLEAFQEPLIEKKIDLDEIYNVQETNRNRGPNRKLRKSLENAFIYRKPWAFIIDEAQHLTKMGSSRGLMNQMDTIKSLTAMSKVPYVLIGTYELLGFRNLSGQLSRRSVNLHFPRYRAQYPEELKIFRNVLGTFQRHLPLEKEPDLIKDWDYFYERCIGCIGVLKDWLLRTYRSKLSQPIKTLTIDDFSNYAYSIDQCNQMIQEASKGEEQFEEDKEKLTELRTSLGLGIDANLQSEDNVDNKRTSRVGQRKPMRDKVGGVKDA